MFRRRRTILQFVLFVFLITGAANAQPLWRCVRSMPVRSDQYQGRWTVHSDVVRVGYGRYGGADARGRGGGRVASAGGWVTRSERGAGATRFIRSIAHCDFTISGRCRSRL